MAVNNITELENIVFIRTAFGELLLLQTTAIYLYIISGHS